jgi:hypothetical protein
MKRDSLEDLREDMDLFENCVVRDGCFIFLAFDSVNRILTIKERGAEDGKKVGKREFLVPSRSLRIPPVRD